MNEYRRKDFLEIDLTGANRHDILNKAFSVGSDYFSVDSDLLFVHSFIATEQDKIESVYGSTIDRNYVATVTVGLKASDVS